jgi:hypothetical protein
MRIPPKLTYYFFSLATNWPIVDDYEFGAVGGMRIGRRKGRTNGKSSPVPLGPPKPHMS